MAHVTIFQNEELHVVFNKGISCENISILINIDMLCISLNIHSLIVHYLPLKFSIFTTYILARTSRFFTGFCFDVSFTYTNISIVVIVFLGNSILS